MSLSHLVLRHLTVLALTGKTLAGNEVRSSLLAPINEAGAEPLPMIAIFTDSGKADRNDIRGLEIITANFAVTLALEFACIASAPMENNGTETFIPQTDEGLEMTLDIMERQAVAELQCGSGPWSELWRQWAMRVVELRTERGASIEKGIRFAARRLEITCEAMADPTPGADLPPLWDEVLTAFAAENSVKDFAPLLRAVATGQPVADWRLVQAALGLTNAGAAAMGIVPMGGDGTVSAAVSLIGEDADTGQEITVTADGATLEGDDGSVALIEAQNG